MLAVQGEAYKKQYGLDSIHLILTNLYGPGDSYNTERSHVVAALVRKWVEADIAKAPSIEVWGTGKPVREFIYVEDCADAIVLAAEKYNDVSFPLNIGTGIGTSIRELVETINAVTGFGGKIAWNADKPDGAMMKVLDVTRMKQRSTAGCRRPVSRRGWPRRSPGTGPTRPRRMPNGEPTALVWGSPVARPKQTGRGRQGLSLPAPSQRSTGGQRPRLRPRRPARSQGASGFCSSTSITGPTTLRRPST